LFRDLALGVATANGLTDALLAFRKVVDIESLRRVCRLEVIEGPAFLVVSETARLIKRYIAPSLFPRRMAHHALIGIVLPQLTKLEPDELRERMVRLELIKLLQQANSKLVRLVLILREAFDQFPMRVDEAARG